MKGKSTQSPFLFNALKHHLTYIRSFISKHRNASLKPLIDQLKVIGSAQMDVYTGALTTESICEEIGSYLKKNDVFIHTKYNRFIGENSGYQLIELSDGSLWVLRVGMQQDKYIHYHPARRGAHRIRVKYSTLKTAILLSCVKPEAHVSNEVINQARIALDISPSQNNDSVRKWLRIFGDRKY